MEIRTFENPQFGDIRTAVDEDGRILFCGSDVATALGYARPADAVRSHAKGSVKRRTLTNRGVQTLTFIPEPDVYRLIIRSKLPAAQVFEVWVMESVLPTLRQHGVFITKERYNELIMPGTQLLELGEKVESLEQRIEQLEPKANYYDVLVAADLCTGIRETAKELKIPERLFTYLLEDMDFAYRDAKKELVPYSHMTKEGYAIRKEWADHNSSGLQMKFTPLGRLYLMRRIHKRLAMKGEK